MQEAAVQALLSAGVTPGGALDVLRARLDPDAPTSLALALRNMGLPENVISQTLATYEELSASVDVQLGAFVDSNTMYTLSAHLPAFASTYPVSAMTTVREIVEQVQNDAGTKWRSTPRIHPRWANSTSEDDRALISVMLDPVATVDIRRNFRFYHRENNLDEYFPPDRYLYDGRISHYVVSPNAKLLTYRGTRETSEFITPL